MQSKPHNVLTFMIRRNNKKDVKDIREEEVNSCPKRFRKFLKQA